MALIIRKPRLKPSINGIPKDFAEVMDYFNSSLRNNAVSWLPRKKEITEEEIKELWLPSLKKNLNLVAILDGKVVGQATVFYNPKSSAYEQANSRNPGDISLTARPDVYKPVITALTKGLVKELKKQGKTATLTTAIESPGNEIMKSLGYTPEILLHQERYIQVGLSGKVCRYSLP